MICLQQGENWRSGCNLCECDKGSVVCMPVVCPTCAKEYYPVYKHSITTSTVDQRSCCPMCQKLNCPKQCGNCIGVPQNLSGHLLADDTSTTVVCTWCRKGYFLQNGDCVGSCNFDRFAKSGQCFPCHKSCHSCTERTKFHCKRFV